MYVRGDTINAIPLDRAAKGTESVIRNCLVLKLLSRDSRIGERADNGRIDFKPVVKLACRSGTIQELITGKETRIELQYHEFDTVSLLVSAVKQMLCFDQLLYRTSTD
jgi:hypothetical protein